MRKLVYSNKKQERNLHSEILKVTDFPIKKNKLGSNIVIIGTSVNTYFNLS